MHTPQGSTGFFCEGLLGARAMILALPPNAAGELVVHPDEWLGLKLIGKRRFALPGGQTVKSELTHSSDSSQKYA